MKKPISPLRKKRILVAFPPKLGQRLDAYLLKKRKWNRTAFIVEAVEEKLDNSN